ncbi:MAG: NAD-dependent epimerase/dehydratase family protein [Dermatophilaceae bacterium]
MGETTRLTVAVTGPTGTFGLALLPMLERDDRVGRVIGIARRPFDPAERGWTKLEYRRGDVRDTGALRTGVAGADVVVHLAFQVMTEDEDTARAINVDGTLGAFRAAAEAGARRFVYASSVAAYGFHRDNPVGMSEDWPTRPAARLLYAREKAELEHLLHRAAALTPGTDLYLLRPPIVLGPDAAGGKAVVPSALGPVIPLVRAVMRGLPAPPMTVPDLPLQFIHQEDVARALLLCVVGAGPPGAYNIAADDVVSLVDVARALGLRPIRVPGGPVAAALRVAARAPLLPSRAAWVETLGHPAIMDTTKARTQLGWRPRHTALDALRETF